MIRYLCMRSKLVRRIITLAISALGLLACRGGEPKLVKHDWAVSSKAATAADRQHFLVESRYADLVPSASIRKREEEVFLVELDRAQTLSLAEAIAMRAPFCGGMAVSSPDALVKDGSLLSPSNICSRPCPGCSLPVGVRYRSIVNDITAAVNEASLAARINEVVNLPDRRFSPQATASSDALLTILSALVPAGRAVVIEKMIDPKTPAGQYSIVVKIPGSVTPSDPGVLVGAHLDTFNKSGGAAPGADDDGTGVATMIELFRALMTASNGTLRFKRDIYLVLYSGEEIGLVGSELVSESFCRERKIDLRGVMQLDMTGFSLQDEKIAYVTVAGGRDPLLNFTERLASDYFGYSSVEIACPTILSNCSDHASWRKRNYPVVFPFEAVFFNSLIHTEQDTAGQLSMSHALKFFNIANAFVVELAEPI